MAGGHPRLTMAFSAASMSILAAPTCMSLLSTSHPLQSSIESSTDRKYVYAYAKMHHMHHHLITAFPAVSWLPGSYPYNGLAKALPVGSDQQTEKAYLLLQTTIEDV